MNEEYYIKKIEQQNQLIKKLRILIDELEERLAIKELSDDFSKENN